MALSGLFARPFPQSVEIAGHDGPITVDIRRDPRARGFRLRVPVRGAPVLTLPKSVRWAQAEAFLLRHRGWLSERMGRRHSTYAMAPGAIIPLRGVDHRLVSLKASRGLVRVCETDEDGPGLEIPGGPEHLRRRLIDWLKQQARQDIEHAAARHADALGVAIAAIRLRDQSTRWGSCSSAHTLNFNWRLVMAPGFVLDYVAAHEVAHLIEMNHSPAFWRTVKRTLPDYEQGRAWLKANGAMLMAI